MCVYDKLDKHKPDGTGCYLNVLNTYYFDITHFILRNYLHTPCHVIQQSLPSSPKVLKYLKTCWYVLRKETVTHIRHHTCSCILLRHPISSRKVLPTHPWHPTILVTTKRAWNGTIANTKMTNTYNESNIIDKKERENFAVSKKNVWKQLQIKFYSWLQVRLWIIIWGHDAPIENITHHSNVGVMVSRRTIDGSWLCQNISAYIKWVSVPTFSDTISSNSSL